MASGTRGYSSYRGRGRKGKIFLAILLILIILGSVGFIMAREHMRYDADGNLHFDLPWDKGTSDPVEAPGDPDVVIREPEQTAVKTPVRGTLLAAKPLTMEDQETAETPLSEAAVTAVTLKDSAGRVYFDSSAAVTGAVSVKPDTGEALNDLTARTDVTAAARIACFHDPKAANADVEGMGLKNTGGYIFYDGNNSQWLDPGHEKARTYLLNIIREAAEQGFREIILTDVSYPTAGKLDKIDFSNAMTAGDTAEAGRQAQIEGFLREVRDALPKNVILSLELPAETVLAGTNSDAGQELSALAPLVDRIYAETTEAEASALETAVKAASAACGFVPELTEQPAEGTENWLLMYIAACKSGASVEVSPEVAEQFKQNISAVCKNELAKTPEEKIQGVPSLNELLYNADVKANEIVKSVEKEKGLALQQKKDERKIDRSESMTDRKSVV